MFDPRASRGLWRSRAMVGRGGSLIVFGLSAAATGGLRGALGTASSLASLALFAALPGKRSAIFATDKAYQRDPGRVRAWVGRAIDMLSTAAIAPIIGAALPLDQASEAHRLVETGAIVGNVVLDCR